MQNGVSTLLFDLGGVILNIEYSRTIEAFEKIGGDDFQLRYSQATQSSLFDDFEIGAINENEFRNGIRALLNVNVSDQEIDFAWNAMLLDLPIGRVDLLKNLRSKYRLILFSNTNEIHFQRFREIIGEQYSDPFLLESLFDKTYYSHQLGKRKPNAEAFETILNQEGLIASEVTFIDDSIQHVQGAIAVGISAHHLKDVDIIHLCNLHF
jgi:putative hydrolase of the HAD superfamily